jgi:hypothetical protein
MTGYKESLGLMYDDNAHESVSRRLRQSGISFFHFSFWVNS